MEKSLLPPIHHSTCPVCHKKYELKAFICPVSYLWYAAAFCDCGIYQHLSPLGTRREAEDVVSKLLSIKFDASKIKKRTPDKAVSRGVA